MTKKTNGQPDATNKGTTRRQNKQKGGEAETMQKATQPWHAEGQQRSAEQATNRHTSSETLRQEQHGEGTNRLLRAQQGTGGGAGN
jgi:hypothetical protein